MSDLLNSASLVMIPSGYKEDTVYSVVPSDGSGDLSFTRASNGTRVNSAGLVEVVSWNLMPWSETFNFATGGWNLQGGAITVANSGTAPNGTNSATLLYPSVNGVIVAPNRRAEPSATPSTAIYTQYVYAKASGKNWLALYQFNGYSGAAAWFNLSTGVVGTVASGCTAFIESAGNGWYKCGFSQSVTASESLYMHIYPTDADNTNAVTASGTNGIYIWGAQLNIGTTAKPYFPTTDRLNVPRLTYQNGGGGCPSLLLEKQSTNIALYSEQFDNANWIKNGTTVTANNRISPDGTQDADSVNFSGGGPIEQLILFAASNQTHTVSAWAKVASGTQQFRLKITHAGVVDYYSPYYTATTEWQRFSFSQAFGSGGIGFYAGVDGGNTMDLWGFQLEPNTSYVSSYIPSTSSSATRVADACFKTGISSLIGQTEGTLFVDIVTPTAIPSGAEILPISIFQSGGGTGGVQAYIAFLSNGVVRFVYFDGALQALISTASGFWSAGNRYKLAAVYKQNDFAFYINGVQIGTDNSGNVSAMADFYLDYQGSVQQNTVNQCALFKTRLTNAELASLTTI